jgi:cytochrome c5
MSRNLKWNSSVACWAAACVLVLAGAGCDDDESGEPGHGAHDDDDASTEHEHEHDGTTSVGPDSGATCPDNSTLTYDNFGKEFMTKYCLRCHSSKVTGAARNMAPADHNFDTLAEIDLLAKHIDEKAASGPDNTNTAMPPSGTKPSVDERKKLGEWLVCGVK